MGVESNRSLLLLLLYYLLPGRSCLQDGVDLAGEHELEPEAWQRLGLGLGLGSGLG